MNMLKNKKKLLWISQCAPYDKVRHAGGQIENFYIKNFLSDMRFSVKLLTFCFDYETKDVISDFEKYGIDNVLIEQKTKGLKYFKRQFFNLYSILSPFDKYANVSRNFYFSNLKKHLKQLKKEFYVPDVILIEWTSLIVLIDVIKKAFPLAKIVTMEEDVTFLSYERYFHASHGINKLLWKNKYKKLKKIEIKSLKHADLNLINNVKDENLVKKEGINNTFRLVPFYHDYSGLDIDFKDVKKQILFYGAMNRRENYLSCIWFIENVFYKLTDKSIKFIIAGNKPSQELLKYKSERIEITGFVDDISEYFSNSLCLVAPLVLGAGIKIKILEGMSSGLPVITNNIGIEGIPAKNNKEFYFCETADDYIKILDKIILNSGDSFKVGKNAKEFIKKEFCMENSAVAVKNAVFELR